MAPNPTGSYTKNTVRRQITAADGSKSLEIINKTSIENGRVLMAIGEKITMPSGNVKENKSVTDAYGREYFSLPIEIEPGYDRNVYSCDPAQVAQMRTARAGDIVNVSGVKRRSGAVRVTEFNITKAAAIVTAVVDSPAVPTAAPNQA